MGSPGSGKGCPGGQRAGRSEEEDPGRAAPTQRASPSRASDSRMLLQVEAISEMACHSSSSVSLPASEMTVGEPSHAMAPPAPLPPWLSHAPRAGPQPWTLTFADGVPQRQRARQEGGPQLWGSVTSILTSWPVLGGRQRPCRATLTHAHVSPSEVCICSPGQGASPGLCWTPTAWPGWPGAGLGWWWAGGGPHPPGSWKSRRAELGVPGARLPPRRAEGAPAGRR